MNLTPKKIYEKITLIGYNPTPEELDALKDTHWFNKLFGGTSGKNPFSKFKNFFKEDDSFTKHMNKHEMADCILDKIEDQFGLHYSNFHDLPLNRDSKLPEVKEHVMMLLQKCKGHVDDKKEIAKKVDSADSVTDVLIKLNFLSNNPLE